ncbi:uncharacterized protein LOC144142226 [Haemaphysalis longicornis]
MSKVAWWYVWTVFFISGTAAYWNNNCPLEYHCSQLQNASPKHSCYYRCCNGGRWYRGQLPDLTRCKLRGQRGRVGQCMRGVCIPVSGSDLPRPPSHPRPGPPEALPSCNEIPTMVGYAQGCSYRCESFSGRVESRTYPGGTRCLVIAGDGNRRVGPAGLCSGGTCIPHEDIEGDYPTILKKVFHPSLYACPEKPYFGRRAVFDCHQYCQVGENWYWGSYMGNTTCQMETPNLLGWCCKGECYRQMWCGRSENSVDNTLP